MGIKKRMLAGAVVGTTVFGASLGLAAGLDVSSVDKIGSGQAQVTSCDVDGVTTNYVYDAASGNVTAVNVDGIANDCNGAVATVAAGYCYIDSVNSSSNSASRLTTGSADVTTYYSIEPDQNNHVTVLLDSPISADLISTVTVTLHGGNTPLPTP